ncbi:Xylose isomerase-like TIM barrel [Paenibacillus sp. UNC496MF]|uniref:sugar phosphate isomerase/epimerase family protein n=1 Tax=Paenibacillus sp. UNC496MF TaxID=1502753 RepID=UPI0008F3D7E9|nr:sugar phosphate isomerase/epimerase [Paenibacillus sp. UNC496MF]SFI85808.1 Xylose isomerase-like TIM barrel [Paenibacillus sp. UNC496MF]
MKIIGYSSNLYGWSERWKSDGKAVDWRAIFRACADAGLDAVEIDADAGQLALLREFGLAVSASYVGLQLHGDYDAVEAGALPVAERLAAAGGKDLLVNADPYGGWKQALPKPEDLVKRQGDNLSRLAARAEADFGLRLSLHNHAADRHNAEADLRSVVECADAAVGLCVDTGWAHVAGCDPVGWVRRYPERIAAFHLRNQRGRVPAEDLTEGDIDFRALADAMADANYEGWLALELWHPRETMPARSMEEDVRRSLAMLRGLVGERA